MAESENVDELCSKHKAITSLLPYAVWQDLSGQPEMLSTLLHAARASKMLWFRWHRIRQFASVLLSEATPHAIVLVSPHMPWNHLADRGDLVQQWAVATSMVPHTEEVAESVVNTLLQIASEKKLLPYIPADTWLWLTKQPSLPPVCLGRYSGTKSHVVEAARRLKDIEILKSYLLLIWSEWDILYSEGAMCTSIREDFSQVGMGHHRADLIERLDYVLGQLGQGLEYLNQHNLDINWNNLQIMEQQYGKLKEVLLEVNIEAITRLCNSTLHFYVY